MKALLIFICLFANFNTYAQITKVGECKVSPDGNLIVFNCYLESVQDLFLYDVSRDTLVRVTNSTNLIFDAQYKTSLNWLDNHRILFLAKFNGIVQQYVLDLVDNVVKPVRISSSHEYFLNYSDVNREVYYVSSRKGCEPAVFKRKLDADKEIKVSKGNINCILNSVSPDGKYLAYKEMPLGKPILVSLVDNKSIKVKMPSKNTSVVAWSPSGDEFIYKHSYFVDNSIIKIEVKLYNLLTQASETVVEDADYFGGCIWAPCADKYFYSLWSKSFLVDRESGTKKEYEVLGHPQDWLEAGKSILFVQDEKAFILNLLDGSIKSVIN